MKQKLRPLPLEAFGQSEAPVPGIVQWSSAEPGPHLGITALVHGNELCGIHALMRLIEKAPRLICGRLSLILCNLDAYLAYDPHNPAAARAADEDMNRVWHFPAEKTTHPTREMRRAQLLRPIIDSLDHLLDLHSMTLNAPPLLLAGPRQKNLAFAQALGLGHAVLIDTGHKAGLRLRDYGAFDDDARPNLSVLIECGQHEDPASAMIAEQAIDRFLSFFGLIAPKSDIAKAEKAMPAAPIIEITQTVTVTDQSFAWTRPLGGLDCIPLAGTPIARECGADLLTPYDNCYMVMPSTKIVVGQTAVRLGRKKPPSR